MKGNRKSNKQIEKAKDFKGTAKKIFKKYLLDYKWQLLIVLIFAIGSTVFTIVGPKISGNATTEIFNGLVNKMSGKGGIDFAKIGKYFALPLVSAICYKYDIYSNTKFCNDKCMHKN